jgi:transcriptional regulator of acetoin/glycerol metabolism
MLTADMVRHRLGDDAGQEPDEPLASPGSSSSGSRPAPPTREELEAILERNKGNVRAIARETDRSRMQVYRWVEQHGLDLGDYRDD